MKSYKDQSHKERTIIGLIFAIIMSFTIFIPNYPIWAYVFSMLFALWGLTENYIKWKHEIKKTQH
ncbi:hypothetical protein [Aquibacillus sediminis]|uniref:hypothetical protein n=1 Tax=Aquibacillus sediminis TaxID=2574734 RepID=UPI0011087DFE|nr:hypothetical protein [Aquibacillus sediminis]